VNQPSAFRPNVPFIEQLGVEFISAGEGIARIALDLNRDI